MTTCTIRDATTGHTGEPAMPAEMPPETYRAKALTEAEMQDGIMQAARRLGFLVFHTHIPHGSAAGFPDVHCVGRGTQLVFEIKGPRGRVSDEQHAWITAYQEAGITAMIVWPDSYDLALETIRKAAGL